MVVVEYGVYHTNTTLLVFFISGVATLLTVTNKMWAHYKGGKQGKKISYASKNLEKLVGESSVSECGQHLRVVFIRVERIWVVSLCGVCE